MSGRLADLTAAARRLNGRLRGSVVARRMAALVGLLLVGVYFVNEFLLRRGPHEFAYLPVTQEPLPYAAMRGFTYEQLWNHVARFVLLTPGLLLLSWPLSHGLRSFVLPETFRRRGAAFLSALGVVLVAAVMLLVLRARAINYDELVYTMQAQFMSEGRLTGPDVGFLPNELFSLASIKGYTGKYLPGEVLVQLPGMLVDAPALLHVPIVALTLWAFHRAVALATDRALAGLAVAFLALSPMYVLTSAIGLSHTTALACVVLSVLGYEWVRAGSTLAGAALVALALGYCALTRLQVAAPVGGVVGLYTLRELFRRRAWAGMSVFFALGVASLVAIGLYNRVLTGSFTKLPWYLQCPTESVGFGPVMYADAYEHTPLRALENLAVVAVRFNGWWLGLPFGLGVLAAWWWLGRPSRGLHVWGWMGIAATAFEFTYYTTGVSDTGPIYHFELLLPAALLLANTVQVAWHRWRGPTTAVILVHAVLGTLPFLVEQTLRVRRIANLAHDDTEQILQAVKTPAIILAEHWDSERLPVGWMTDSFPKRWRRQSDPIVNYPRPHPERLHQLLAAYPGRNCYYYHRDPQSLRLELLPCVAAGEYLARGLVRKDGQRAMGHASTAYARTAYDPNSANLRRSPKTASGIRLIQCCHFEELRRAGEVLPVDLPCLKEPPR